MGTTLFTPRNQERKLFFRSALAALSALVVAAATSRAEGPATFVDPSVNHGIWEGWGTALCWWAKVLGNRDEIADLLFTTRTVDFNGAKLPGLGLNIVRYNAGACGWNEIDGRKMSASKTILPFRQIEGFWLDGKSEDSRSAGWNWEVDANQRLMLQKARDRGANRFELFSNSPMWWMCRNANPSGAAKASDDNLPHENFEKFAVYLAEIAKTAKDRWGVTFTTVEAFNEPNTTYWNANGKQEGCHFSHEAQAAVLPLLRAELDKRGLRDLPISASDETSYDQAIATWGSFGPETKALISQVNVHGYQNAGGRRDVLFESVSKSGKRLWNSEYGENDATGLKLAHNLDLDFRSLHPSAWCYWQPFDAEGWGLVVTDVPNRKFLGINPKYYVIAQYSRHIRPGMSILETGDTDTVAAFDPIAHRLVLVIRNEKQDKKTIDLSKFASADGPVTRWITEPQKSTRYERHQDVRVFMKRLEVITPTDSVQTLEVENVR
jgi:galactan endo-1,6-beta-galactosidase